MYLSVNKKINFTQMARFGRSCESRFRDDVRLRYIYRGPKAHKRGRPKLYDGDVDIDSPDMNVFRKAEVSSPDYSIRSSTPLLYLHLPWCKHYSRHRYSNRAPRFF